MQPRCPKILLGVDNTPYFLTAQRGKAEGGKGKRSVTPGQRWAAKDLGKASAPSPPAALAPALSPVSRRHPAGHAAAEPPEPEARSRLTPPHRPRSPPPARPEGLRPLRPRGGEARPLTEARRAAGLPQRPRGQGRPCRGPRSGDGRTRNGSTAVRA